MGYCLILPASGLDQQVIHFIAHLLDLAVKRIELGHLHIPGHGGLFRHLLLFLHGAFQFLHSCLGLLLLVLGLGFRLLGLVQLGLHLGNGVSPCLVHGDLIHHRLHGHLNRTGLHVRQFGLQTGNGLHGLLPFLTSPRQTGIEQPHILRHLVPGLLRSPLIRCGELGRRQGLIPLFDGLFQLAGAHIDYIMIRHELISFFRGQS